MKKLAKFLFTTYQIIFTSPLVTCRFRPTCSQYTLEAIEKYGAFKGLLLGAKRIVACHPFSKRPIYDPA
jgi:putative membrane protein insertion efficiency factor